MIYFWSDIIYCMLSILICKQVYTIIVKEITQQTERRLLYITLIILGSWCLQLYIFTTIVLTIMACALTFLCIRPFHYSSHLSSPMHYTSTRTQQQWPALLISNLVTIQKNTINTIHICIGPEALLSDQLYTPCPMRMPTTKNSLLLLLSTGVLDTTKYILISDEGTIIGINATTYLTAHEKNVSEQNILTQEYNFFCITSTQCAQRYTITHKTKQYKNINAAQTTTLLEQYIHNHSAHINKNYEEHTHTSV